MNLDLDTQWLRATMKLWCEVVEHKIPVHGDLNVHLMSRQADNLKNFIQIGQSRKTVLGSCKPTSPQDEIEALMAKAKLAAIEELGVEEMFTDAAQDLLSDPELGPTIRGMLKSIRKQDPKDDKGQGTTGS